MNWRPVFKTMCRSNSKRNLRSRMKRNTVTSLNTTRSLVCWRNRTWHNLQRNWRPSVYINMILISRSKITPCTIVLSRVVRIWKIPRSLSIILWQVIGCRIIEEITWSTVIISIVMRTINILWILANITVVYTSIVWNCSPSMIITPTATETIFGNI